MRKRPFSGSNWKTLMLDLAGLEKQLRDWSRPGLRGRLPGFKHSCMQFTKSMPSDKSLGLYLSFGGRGMMLVTIHIVVRKMEQRSYYL